MATKPGMVPEDAKWLVMDNGLAYEADSRQSAIDWIENMRREGSHFTYILYAPDSLHEIEVRNKVVWERLNG